MRYDKAVENIIVNCLRIGAGDRVVVITETDRLAIGQAIVERARQIAPAELVVIEDHADRPAKTLPESMVGKLRQFKPTVSVYAATGKEGELPVFRAPLISLLVNELSVRHGHMIGISEKLMESGMSLDYEQVQIAIAKLYKILKKAKTIKVTDPFGTDLTVKLSPKLRWVPCDGQITKAGEWSNLPEGEIFTCPGLVDGSVAAWVIGDHFDKYGVLKEPLMINIENNLISKVSSQNKTLEKEFIDYVSQYENGNRVGEFAIGALLGLTELTGNLLQDEKFPGVHMAFGHSYPEKTGAKWDCPSHVDVIPLQVTIEIDHEVIMRDGAFCINLN